MGPIYEDINTDEDWSSSAFDSEPESAEDISRQPSSASSEGRKFSFAAGQVGCCQISDKIIEIKVIMTRGSVLCSNVVILVAFIGSSHCCPEPAEDTAAGGWRRPHHGG